VGCGHREKQEAGGARGRRLAVPPPPSLFFRRSRCRPAHPQEKRHRSTFAPGDSPPPPPFFFPSTSPMSWLGPSGESGEGPFVRFSFPPPFLHPPCQGWAGTPRPCCGQKPRQPNFPPSSLFSPEPRRPRRGGGKKRRRGGILRPPSPFFSPSFSQAFAAARIVGNQIRYNGISPPPLLFFSFCPCGVDTGLKRRSKGNAGR